jgi:phosphoglycolate phosphatase-like HAD superfamily hydrolase
MTLYIFDIDGTLADVEHRRHYVTNKPKNWKAWNANLHLDEPVKALVTLNNTLFDSGATVLICSGREEDVRQPTEEWLAEHGVQYHEFLMRPAKNYERDDIIKGRMADHIESVYGPISMVFDDRDQVVAMWRKRGILCAQVAEGNF